MSPSPFISEMKDLGPLHDIYHDVSPWEERDAQLFKEGNCFHLYQRLGAHPWTRDGVQGTYFGVWAPNAEKVSVVGEFNGWNKYSHPLAPRWDSTGVWEGFVPGVGKGALYKFFIQSRFNKYSVEKKDPYAFFAETPPHTASVVWQFEHEWNDQAWMRSRAERNGAQRPMSIYEVHLGSWRRVVEEGGRFLTYRELANYLVDYVKQMGFTHVELMPVMDHPFYGSWGYQTLGYFSPTARYGTPEDLMAMIDCFHQNGIGVILDWVPSHFPTDGHGLSFFDGTHLFEHSDPRRGFHPDWKCCIFNNGRNEVKAFLISSALFWFDYYHVDGLRVDAVASMLYLDYSRKEGEWTPNIYGGREDIESIAFIRKLNEVVYAKHPDVQMIAEESTSWGGVSRPTYAGGLGFGMKWNMGWMHDTLEYFKKDPIYRKHHHNDLTFSMLYAFTENFTLSLSHDEVVHGKCSLLSKMPSNDWQKFANLRLLFGYLYTHPGKKLLFMGGEFGQRHEWNHEQSLDWHLLQYPPHRGVQTLVKELNALYRRETALFKYDFEPRGFEWVECNDWQQSVLTYIRRGDTPQETLLIVCNFTPTPRSHYGVGVPVEGEWEEVLNTDAAVFGGSGVMNAGILVTRPVAMHGRPQSLELTLPPLASVIFKPLRRVSSDQNASDTVPGLSQG